MFVLVFDALLSGNLDLGHDIGVLKSGLHRLRKY